MTAYSVFVDSLAVERSKGPCRIEMAGTRGCREYDDDVG